MMFGCDHVNNSLSASLGKEDRNMTGDRTASQTKHGVLAFLFYLFLLLVVASPARAAQVREIKEVESRLSAVDGVDHLDDRHQAEIL
jgi:hypothetical protein